MATVYRKTDKGHAEIDTRAHRLVPRLRSALILVDGRKSDEDLAKMIPGQPEEALKTLLEQEFIEVIAVTTPKPAPRPGPTSVPPATSSAPPSSGKAVNTFEARKRAACHFLEDNIGPMSEALALKIEAAPDLAALMPLLEIGREMLRNTRGSAVAAAYTERFLGEPG